RTRVLSNRISCVNLFRSSVFAGLTAGCALVLMAAEKSPPDPKAAPEAQATLASAYDPALAQFQKVVSPILQERCYECHGDGAKKAGLAFDLLTSADQILHNPQLWLNVLRNTRSHIMPPPGEQPPTAAQQQALEQWIKTSGFQLDPKQPDPGR